MELRSTENRSRYTGKINADGTFELSDSKGNVGCPPGMYDAVVVQVVMTEDLAFDQHTHGRTVPRRYADYYTSGLRVEVNVEHNTPVVIELEE